MKKLILSLTLLVTMSSFAGFGEIISYTNDSECLVQVSKNGNWIVINASKQVDGDTEQVQVSFSLDLEESEIGSYCSEYNEKNSTVTSEGNATVISCINNRGIVKTDLDEDLGLTSFNFTGHHYFFLKKIDDSFSCKNLTLEK